MLPGATVTASVFLVRNQGVAGHCSGCHCSVSPINLTWRENTTVLFSEEENSIPKTRLRGNHSTVDTAMECENLVICVG